MALTTHPLLLPMLRMGRTILYLPLTACLACYGKPLPFKLVSNMDSLQNYICNIHTLSDADSFRLLAAGFIIKGKNKFLPVSKQLVNKTHGKIEAELHAFLISALDGAE
jgi:hypothetical protein